MYALSVMITVKPEHALEFQEAALRHAANTKTNETGCLGFEVFVAESDPARFYLHELYSSKQAVEEVHAKAPYLATFRETTKGWILSQDIQTWNGAE